jgi:hypothetical protein
LSLSSDDLGEEVILRDVFAGVAEREVKQRDPDWATRTGDALEHLTAAARFLTASNIAPALTQLTSFSIGDFRWTRKEWDGAKEAARLRGLAAAELAAVLSTDGVVAPLPAFWTVSGCRGR